MSNHSSTPGARVDHTTDRTTDRTNGLHRVLTETKSAVKTTEFWIFLVVTIGIIIAANAIDENEDGQGFGAAQAGMYVTVLAVGYMISRGLAKAGTHGPEHTED